ncbi:MAG TPA: DUF2272 domain-containing protein [Burkholderiales bacterium]|nr:DUF2272 domain-containing protein [Burkholderiales bacterium]
MRLVPLLGAALLAAGCATPRPPGPPPLTPGPSIVPNFDVPSMRARMVFLAEQEWELFGRGVVERDAGGTARIEFAGPSTHEVQPAMLSRVLMYWYAVTRAPIVGRQGELEPWSAAFISWLARSAGLTPEEFPSTVFHWDYIERFLAAGDGTRFVARDPRAYAPRVGDLVCISRSDAVTDFGSLRRGPYHCDLVVGTNAQELEVVGGNVGDIVARARFGVDERGLLVPRDDRPWVAVIEQRSPR